MQDGNFLGTEHQKLLRYYLRRYDVRLSEEELWSEVREVIMRRAQLNGVDPWEAVASPLFGKRLSNVIRDCLRAYFSKAHVLMDPLEVQERLVSSDTSPEFAAARSERIERFLGCCGRQTPSNVQLVQMRLEGASCRTAAQALGKSESNVRRRWKRLDTIFMKAVSDSA
jgi:DNA-directed RNA polymerase specialized sigma24 family protein